MLFEHQSAPDPSLPLWLLRYLTRIWERFRRQHPLTAKLPVVLPVLLSQNAEVWHIAPRLSTLPDIPEAVAGELVPFIPDFEYQHLQLADMAFEAIPGTPSDILVLRVMKAERLGQLLADPVWDERLMARLPLELLQMVLRYQLGAGRPPRAKSSRQSARMIQWDESASDFSRWGMSWARSWGRPFYHGPPDLQ